MESYNINRFNEVVLHCPKYFYNITFRINEKSSYARIFNFPYLKAGKVKIRKTVCVKQSLLKEHSK